MRGRFARFRQRPRSRIAKTLDMLVAFALLACVAVIAARFDRIATRTFGGRAAVADGDSLVLDGMRVRLRGIDAPELAQICARGGVSYPCGREAKAALSRLVRVGVACDGSEIDKYGRLLAYCRSGETDVNAAMVRSGWAVAYGNYAAEETAARSGKTGLWAGAFERPKDWRAAQGSVAEPDHVWWQSLANWIAQIAGWRPVFAKQKDVP